MFIWIAGQVQRTPRAGSSQCPLKQSVLSLDIWLNSLSVSFEPIRLALTPNIQEPTLPGI